MDPSPYYLVRAKLDRAHQHLECLDEAIQGFLETNPYRSIPDLDRKTGHHLVRVEVRQDPPVLEWGVVIGDVLHNLRSALDHLAWILGGNPPPNEGSSEFPIWCSKVGYRNEGIKKVVGVPDHPLAIIEDLQPYHRGNRAHLDPLWSLFRLSNFDKHRLLHVSGAVIRAASFRVGNAPGMVAETDEVPFRLGPFEHSAVVATWPADPGTTEPNVNVPFQFTFGIAFDHEGPGRGQPVIEGLRRIEQRIGINVLPRLGPWLFD